jgi:pimeloyl-ACP methyl ester carboxylesterase
MDNLRTYGRPPFTLALLHGGPGVSGEMAPVAQELSGGLGVLEPLQTRDSVDGQVEELKLVLEEMASVPVILAGYSWGAWLGFLLASRHPAMVKKLILISSGPFEEKYFPQLLKTRLQRLSKKERDDVEFLMARPEDPLAFGLLGELLAKADYYDPLPMTPEGLELRPEIFKSVWKEAAELRKSGKLLEAARFIQCPVVAIHGDHDPHPAEGVQKPLSAILKDFRFVLLEKCGHTPWMEKQARDTFFFVLEKELGSRE